VQARLTEYICIRVSGFLEQAVRQIFYELARRKGDRALARFVSEQLSWETNFNAERLCNVIGRFDPDWQRDMEAYLQDDNRKNALDSIKNNRNNLAHGEWVGVGLATMKEWYKRVTDSVDHLEHLVLS
jgi:hypothetical protein